MPSPGRRIGDIPGLTINPDDFRTNILILSLEKLPLTAAEFVQRLQEHGVLAGAVTEKALRFVTHKDVNKEQIKTALRIITQVVKGVVENVVFGK